MPIDRKHYSSNWSAIALEVKNQANWTCENCKRLCRMPGENLSDFTDRIATGKLSECPVVAECLKTPQRFTLTVAHLDQNPANNDRANLRALCSVCHLHHDRPFVQHNRYRKRERNGQLTLLEL